jgi:nucleoid-associated protein YgaU
VTLGDTLASISRQYFGTPDYYMAIARMNGISDPNSIYQGMRLKIDMGIAGGRPAPVRRAAPAPAGKIVYHTVAAGETLMSISRRYFGGDSSYYMEIARMNNISNPNALYRGMRLKIDTGMAGGRTVVQPAPKPAPTPAPTGKVVYHYVNPGDTLENISERYFGSTQYAVQIAEMNGIADPANLQLGTKLTIDLGIKENL